MLVAFAGQTLHCNQRSQESSPSDHSPKAKKIVETLKRLECLVVQTVCQEQKGQQTVAKLCFGHEASGQLCLVEKDQLIEKNWLIQTIEVDQLAELVCEHLCVEDWEDPCQYWEDVGEPHNQVCHQFRSGTFFRLSLESCDCVRFLKESAKNYKKNSTK